jgi:arsenate reductase-like glutaredoxin family protein
LRSQGVTLDERDLAKRPMSAAEIEALIGDRDWKQFVNTRKKPVPESRAELARLAAADPNYLRRPIIITDGQLQIGWKGP